MCIRDRKYTNLLRLSDHYWKKHSGNPNFFEYLRVLRYFDDSLFRTVKQLLPARAKKQVGLLVKPHLLERPRILMYPSASREHYYSDIVDDPLDQTVIDGTLDVYASMSFSGYVAAEVGPFITQSGKPNKHGNRMAGYMLTPPDQNAAISKDYLLTPNLTNELKAKALDNRTVGEIEVDLEYDKFGYKIFENGSRYIHTTIEFPTGKPTAGTGPTGARVWNAYYNRDAWGMTVHTPPHAVRKLGQLNPDGSPDNSHPNYDDYTASSAPDVTDGWVKWGLNRKKNSEIYIPFISQSRFSFERSKRLYYYANEFSMSAGKPIAESLILSNAVLNYGRLSGQALPSHKLSEKAEYQDFKQTPLANLYWNGCKLNGSDFNMESSETVDGGPVVEYYEISPYKYVAADESADGRILTSGEGTGETLAERESQAPVGRRFTRPPGQSMRGSTISPRSQNNSRRNG